MIMRIIDNDDDDDDDDDDESLIMIMMMVMPYDEAPACTCRSFRAVGIACVCSATRKAWRGASLMWTLCGC